LTVKIMYVSHLVLLTALLRGGIVDVDVILKQYHEVKRKGLIIVGEERIQEKVRDVINDLLHRGLATLTGNGGVKVLASPTDLEKLRV